jgi:thymidylate kinase
MSRKRGVWICVTGIDGTGKTSLCRYLTRILGKKTKFMKSPYFDWLRDMIKLSGSNTPNGDRHTDMLLFSANNRLEMYLIKDLLGKCDYLVTQRCWLDNFPYRKAQGVSWKKSFEFLKPEKFINPDIIFWLKCDYRTAYERIKNDNGDKYEEPCFMKKTEIEFEKMFSEIKNNSFLVKLPKMKIIEIDARQKLSAMKKEALKHLGKLKILSA